jgi:hypothetical protein
MKKSLLSALFLFGIAITLNSCKKEKTDEITNVTLDVSINAGETYKLDLSAYGDADDKATITKQAADFVTSEIAAVGIIGEYQFLKAGAPKVGGNGTETVVLKVSEGHHSGGCHNGNVPSDSTGNHGGQHKKRHHIEETNITINFTIL